MMKAWIICTLTFVLAPLPFAAQEPRPGNEAVQAGLLTTAEMSGAPVYGPTGEQLGAVASLVMDPQGKVEAALVELGGLMGLGAKEVLLPIGDLTIERDKASGALRIYSAATVEELDAMPGHE